MLENLSYAQFVPRLFHVKRKGFALTFLIQPNEF